MKKILSLLFISLFFITHAQAITIAYALRTGAYKVSKDGSKVDLSGRGIDSWYGVQFIKKQFPNMQELNLSHNQLPSVPLLARSLVKDSVTGIVTDTGEFIVTDIGEENGEAIVVLNLEYNNIEWVEWKLDDWLNRNVYYLYLTGNPMSAEEINRLKYHALQGDFRVSFKSAESHIQNKNGNVVANAGSSSSFSSSTQRRGPPPRLSRCPGSSNS